MPNTCRIDTFMSGSPVGSWVAILFILPPCPGTRRDPLRFGLTAPATPQTGGNTPPNGTPPPESAPAYGLQIIVGLNDVPQLVLAGAIAAVGVGLAVDPDLPGRTMAGNGLLLISGNRVFAHSGKKIVGMIVVAHVMKAEAPICARAQAPLGRPMGGVLAAAGPIAGRIARLRAAVLCRLDPDAVEQR